MKRKFLLAEFLIKLALVLGWVSLAGGVFSFLMIMFYAIPGLVITGAILREALMAAGWGILAFVLFGSWAESLKILLAIEENTRKM